MWHLPSLPQIYSSVFTILQHICRKQICVLNLLGGDGRYLADPKAFLFSLVNKPGWAPVKLPQRKDPRVTGGAVVHIQKDGPTFGYGYDLHVDATRLKDGHKYSSWTSLGKTYTPPNGYSFGSTFAKTFLHGGSDISFIPDEVEMFYETT